MIKINKKEKDKLRNWTEPHRLDSYGFNHRVMVLDF